MHHVAFHAVSSLLIHTILGGGGVGGGQVRSPDPSPLHVSRNVNFHHQPPHLFSPHLTLCHFQTPTVDIFYVLSRCNQQWTLCLITICLCEPLIIFSRLSFSKHNVQAVNWGNSVYLLMRMTPR